ncbi:molybdate ABC transporter permease subunit [Seleniivibrio woodruffii]|uniref:Molybdate transport system permease protein n=1 Tax=Seleniivibrio woodruffii TaxID=1078050 RepID=A0A4V6NEF8_9BACT|nr:ABC transporter permease subunit [Seleniivibrio woodruffii]TCK60591.1 molybdate transport system permease protein [Seleniivibrio woodruffii]TVZ36220.1 molybdate transport system permease protein [Seleniivibrio woodruffii]
MDLFLNELTSQQIIFSIFLTAKVCFWAFLLHGFFGILLAWYLSSEKAPFRNVINIIISFPLVFPPIATGFLLLMVFGRFGVLGKYLQPLGVEIIFTQKALVLAAFTAGLPLVVKPIQSAIASSAKNLIEASLTLGKSRLTTFIRVVVPNVRKSIFAGLALGVGRSMGEVGITLMIGGNIIGKTNTLSLEIYNAVFDGNYLRAGVLCVILLGVSVILFTLLRRMETRSV